MAMAAVAHPAFGVRQVDTLRMAARILSAYDPLAPLALACLTAVAMVTRFAGAVEAIDLVGTEAAVLTGQRVTLVYFRLAVLPFVSRSTITQEAVE